ncbi:MAG: hypothetical protein H6668_20860 [Ardenticatenaceae bacterium]|nr:hypothetical protein [Ardenticatenaceae bacterium]
MAASMPPCSSATPDAARLRIDSQRHGASVTALLQKPLENIGRWLPEPMAAADIENYVTTIVRFRPTRCRKLLARFGLG